MSAVAGTFVKIEPVATRKVVRLHIECPIERANEILAALGGYPDPANPQWIGIAPLKGEPRQQGATVTEHPKRKLIDLPAPQQAALTCQREAFWRYLADEHHHLCPSESEAGEFVRRFCKVKSRSELSGNEQARQRWNLLLSGFEAWLEAA